MAKGKVHIGTAGWHYQHWIGSFYPEGVRSPREITADFVYVRLHGPGAAYQGSYDTAVLSGWAGTFSTWRRQGRDVYCYFDNDEKGYAAVNALELKKMVEG